MDGGYYKKGFGRKSQVRESIAHDYHSGLVLYIQNHGFSLSRGGLTVRLAKDFGFCYGVDRTVQYAYETRVHFPERPIYITGEIIHNPHVNQRLIALGMEFLSGPYRTDHAVEDMGPGDVVIIPAFGATAEQIAALRGRECVLVDTTCGSVMNVWKNVERYAREGVTSIIHGKFWHEETRATCSQVQKYPGAHYLVARDMAEAQAVCAYIRGGGDREALQHQFREAVSPGFDPDRDLRILGLANQTTMLSSESLAIGEALRQALRDRWGDGAVRDHYRAFDTICSATQDRQDAMQELIRHPIDLFIVVGGFNSSNTTHLAEIAQTRAPAFHIESADHIISPSVIRHRDPHTGDVRETEGWLPDRDAVVGFTSGASTPNADLGRAVERLFEVRGIGLGDLELPEPQVETGTLPVVES